MSINLPLLIPYPEAGQYNISPCALLKHQRISINLAGIIKNADIVIAALGKPEFLTGDMVKEDKERFIHIVDRIIKG